MTEASVPHLFIDFAPVDYGMYTTDCHCGRCDRDGNSYGISIFDVQAFPQVEFLLKPEPPSDVVDAFSPDSLHVQGMPMPCFLRSANWRHQRKPMPLSRHVFSRRVGLPFIGTKQYQQTIISA